MATIEKEKRLRHAAGGYGRVLVYAGLIMRYPEVDNPEVNLRKTPLVARGSEVENNRGSNAVVTAVMLPFPALPANE